MMVIDMFDALMDGLEAITSSQETVSDFQDKVYKILKNLESKTVRILKSNDVSKAKNVCLKLKPVLVFIRLLPLELKVALEKFSYHRVMSRFVTIYLDLMILLSASEEKPEEFCSDFLRELFIILGEMIISIWGVIANSTVNKHVDIFEAIVRLAFDRTKKSPHNHAEYLRMVYVVNCFRESEADTRGKVKKASEVEEDARRVVPPSDLVKYLCHHFPGYGWKGLNNKDIQNKLFSSEKGISKSFFGDLFKKIRSEDIDTMKQNSDNQVTSEQEIPSQIVRLTNDKQKISNNYTKLKNGKTPVAKTQATRSVTSFGKNGEASPINETPLKITEGREKAAVEEKQREEKEASLKRKTGKVSVSSVVAKDSVSSTGINGVLSSTLIEIVEDEAEVFQAKKRKTEGKMSTINLEKTDSAARKETRTSRQETNEGENKILKNGLRVKEINEKEAKRKTKQQVPDWQRIWSQRISSVKAILPMLKLDLDEYPLQEDGSYRLNAETESITTSVSGSISSADTILARPRRSLRS